MPDGLPHNPYFLFDLSPIAREDAILEAAGAFDADPTIIQTTGMDKLVMYVSYTRGAVGGAVTLRPEYSPDQDGEFYRQTLYEAATMVAGTDLVSDMQREDFQYTSVGATVERFVITLQLDGAFERVRVPCAESGVVGTPGTCEIIARLM